MIPERIIFVSRGITVLEKLHNEELCDLHLPNTAYYLGDQTNDGKMDGMCVMCAREEELIQGYVE